MVARCTNPRHVHFSNYGGRGIRICERWRHSFAAFLEDMGPRPDGLTIDRFPDNNGNYEPGNCRWASLVEQANNRRGNSLVIYQGESMTVSMLARRSLLPVHVVKYRLKVGWPVDRAASEPVRPRKATLQQEAR